MAYSVWHKQEAQISTDFFLVLQATCHKLPARAVASALLTFS